ncbi:hypothetical protein [Croceibacterium salegens]|uniref:hypothetical protein n=1 Tax=Croceibacterium salegens TaxID=1737568 RepID=UPI000B02EFE5|nr:hypothetical protein [Croceibacterium salegens]
MMLGLPLAQFTQLHVAISLVGILAGVVFFAGAIRGSWLRLANGVFLLFTVLTSATGFLFPPKPIGPPFIFGVISLVLLAVALYALYGRKLAGRWHGTYMLTALIAQWLNMIVLIVQSFQKIPALNALAPLGNEPPVLGAQTVLLAAVAYTGWVTVWKGRPAVGAPAL